ncbi:hypothetical protein [Amycolatopsis cihanbeyliensis]|uniref:Uncharacterized protein n=1 Tax=Amycolatopsis cihanbeyliensis TaxID=1128664 RepID=A0A542DLH4_AMYCI|nr:hypothetical protein [Amycolatopsis cihanbeyliensis]TQJ03937.1 hypothetical protein FB471_3712 [Amycolatopsis cihanbeyliensis]
MSDHDDTAAFLGMPDDELSILLTKAGDDLQTALDHAIDTTEGYRQIISDVASDAISNSHSHQDNAG